MGMALQSGLKMSKQASSLSVFCILYFSDSNNSLEVNYLAFETKPNGSQTGTTSLNSWTTGTECKRIDFQQVRIRVLSIIESKEISNEFLKKGTKIGGEGIRKIKCVTQNTKY